MTALSNFFGGSGSWYSGPSNWKCETFTSSGTFDPTGKGSGEFTVILVGGGGSGGSNGGQGYGGQISIADITIPASNTANVVIGTGGTAGAASGATYYTGTGNPGSASTLKINSTLILSALGGGGYQGRNGTDIGRNQFPVLNYSKYFPSNTPIINTIASSTDYISSTPSGEGHSWGAKSTSTTPPFGFGSGGVATSHLLPSGAGGDGVCFIWWRT